MEFAWIWKGILIVTVGVALLRLAGRKSISQMTVGQTIIMVSIGNLLVQPVANESIWIAFGIASIFIATLIIIEYIQVKSETLEGIISGNAVMLIKEGQIVERNLRKHRMTADKLELSLRQNQISRISDVQYATMEANGQLGILLYPHAQPATKKDIEELIQLINTKLPFPDYTPRETQESMENLFVEIEKKHANLPIPKHLQ